MAIENRLGYLWSTLVGIFLFIGMAVNLSTAQTHTVVIRVLDAESSERLSLATVLIQPGDISGISDADGKVELQLGSGSYQLIGNFLGYEEAELDIEIRGDTLILLPLLTHTTGLQVIEVTGTDAREALRRPVMGVQRISQKQLGDLPAVMGEVDVLKGLQLLPGVTSAGEASNGISVRGGSIDQNLVLLEHAPIFNPTHLFGLFSVFPPDGVRSADLFQGNIPARYGGRIASVLDVQLQSPAANIPILSGGIGLVSSRLSLETPVVKDKLYAYTALRVGFNDFWFDLIDRLKDTKANFGDGMLKLRWIPSEKHNVQLTGFYSKDYYQIDLINRFAGVTADKNIYDYQTLNGTLDWHYQLDDAIYLETVMTAVDYQPSILLPEIDSEHEAIFSSRILYQSISSILNREQTPELRWSTGIQLNRYDNRPGDLDPNGTMSVNAITLPRELGIEASGFVDTEWQPTANLSLSAGLRYTHYFQMGPQSVRQYENDEEISDDNVETVTTYDKGQVVSDFGGLEPRFGLRWSLSEQMAFKAAYSRNRQYLQNIYNATTPLPTSRWKTSDVHIPPQSSHLFSAGLFYNTTNEMQFSFETYYRATTNILEYRPGADFYLKEYVETEILQGEGTTYGFELAMRKNAGRNSGWINYTYARGFNLVEGPDFSNRINDGQWYPNYFDRPHTLNVVYTLDGGKHHALSLNFTLSSGRPYSVPNGTAEINGVAVPIFLERNNGRIPAYHRLDMSWKIRNPSMKEDRRWIGEWIFTVYNIYGRKNAYNIYYGPRQGGDGAVFGSSPVGSYRISIFAAPIASLTYQFTFQ